MLQIAFELTNRCDIACLHCLRDKNDFREDIDRAFLVRVLDEAKTLGVRTISFTGGEPTLHKDFLYFVDEVAKHGFRWITVTNGHNLELMREVFSDAARLKSLSLLAISVDGATEETHDKIRGKGSFKKIMRTMTVLSSLGVNVRFQMTLTKINMPEMEDFILLASSVGAKAAYFGYLQATKKNVAADLMLTPEEFRRAQLTISRLSQAFKIEVGHTFGYFHPSPLLKCSILNNNSMNVDYQGKLIFCCQLSNFGDVSYVPDRQEVIGDLTTMPLVEGYKILLDRIADYNKEKAERLALGQFKPMDYFPCHYCAKKFGKLGWLKDKDVAENPIVKAWADDHHELPRALQEQESFVMPSLYPNH